MKDQRSSIVAASRHDSITTTLPQKFQSLEKRAAKSSNGWKFAGMLFATLGFSSMTAHAFPNWIGNCCSHANRVTTGTIYAGDLVRFEIMMNQDYVGLGAKVGINDGGWTAYDMTYGGNDSGNSWWYYEKRFSSGTKNFYFEGWETFSGSKIYDNNSSANYNVTITALNDPSSPGATANSTSAITVNWTKNAQSHSVIVVRSTDSSFTAPTQGTSYTAGSSTIGGDLVVYKGEGTSFQDTGLSSSTRYYYKIYSENYSYYSAGVTADATTQTPATPTITVSGGSISFTNVPANSYSANQTYTVSGANLTANITITAPSGFQVSTSSSSGFGSTVTLTQAGGSVASTTIYARFAPTAGTAYSGNITHASTSATTVNKAVSGTGIAAPGAPSAKAASGATDTSFSANWDAGSGGTPTNYFLDIATDSAFNNKVSGFDNKSVGNVTTYSVTGLKVGQYYYRVRAQNLAGTSASSSTISAGTTTANTRNKGGAASPATSPSPAYRGDTVTFEFESWATIGVNYGAPRLWVSSSSTLTVGSATDWGGFVNTDTKSISRQFTTAGTFYWGIQMDYGAEYGTNFWYVRNNASWAPMYYNPTNNDLSITVSELTAPTLGTIAVDATHPATRIDLSWTKWNGKNVMITRAIATPTGSPTQGTTHNVNDTFGNQTVIVGSTDATSYEVTGLTPGTTYYFTLYSENYGYHSTGATFTATPTGRPKAQNTGGGGAQPNQPANLYLGDTNKLFTFESWATLEGNYGRAFLWLRHNNADVSGGTRFSGAGFTNVDYKAVSSGQFTQTGTWYWGMQMDYGSPYGSNFWYKASAGTWADMAANGSGSTLSVTVNALGAPTDFEAVAANANAIDLDWVRWTGADDVTRNVLIVRREGAAVTWTPTAGTVYSVGATPAAGHTVVQGSIADDQTQDTGLTAGTTYHYAIFSENYGYYSTAATASAVTPKVAQTITFNALGNKTYGDSSFPVSATADSGLTVSFSSLDESVATVDGTTVTIVGAGTATIRASQAGNATYDAAPNVDRSFTVSPKAITGSFTAENKTYNGNTSATVASRSLTGVINDDVVTLSGGTATFDTATAGNGKTVTLTGATLTGTDAGNYTLTSVSTTTADITKANQTITFAGGAWQSKAPGDAAFELVASASSGLTVTFESSNTGVATVSGNTVTIVGAGTTTITASQAGNENYNAATSVSYDLVVSAEVTPPSAPDAYTATALTLTSFQANWSSVPGAASYRLDVATTAGFTGNYVSGYQDATIGSNSEVVTGLTAGQSYYYRVRAVNDQGTSANSSTITVTLPTPVATIADAPVGQIEFVAAPNLTYEIKYSDNDPGAAMSWSTAATVTPGTTAGSGAITETSRRYFQVVVQGETPSTQESAIWGIIKPSVPAGYSLFSPPLAISDLSFTGQLGQVLGDALVGNSLKSGADFISVRENGGWTKYYLDDQGVWHNFSTDNPLTSEALLPGQGVYIYSAEGATPRFTGPVGNTGSKTVSLASGDWNIIGVSEGKNRTLSNLVFEGGTPTSGTRISQENYDMIVIDTGGGAWRTFARLNNAWVDISGSTAPAVIEPGDGVYYFRYGAAGMSIRF